MVATKLSVALFSWIVNVGIALMTLAFIAIGELRENNCHGDTEDAPTIAICCLSNAGESAIVYFGTGVGLGNGVEIGLVIPATIGVGGGVGTGDVSAVGSVTTSAR